MAVTLDDVKVYLRIDGEEEDSFLLQCIAAAESYLVSSIDHHTENYETSEDYAAKADLVKQALISEMYRNRDPSNDGRSSFSFFVQSALLQLQTWGDSGD